MQHQIFLYVGKETRWKKRKGDFSGNVLHRTIVRHTPVFLQFKSYDMMEENIIKILPIIHNVVSEDFPAVLSSPRFTLDIYKEQTYPAQ